MLRRTTRHLIRRMVPILALMLVLGGLPLLVDHARSASSRIGVVLKGFYLRTGANQAHATTIPPNFARVTIYPAPARIASWCVAGGDGVPRCRI